jgi:stress response protein SCP2
MNHTATVQLIGKTTNPDGTIQVSFDDLTGFAYGDESGLVIDCELRDSQFPDYLKSLLICMLVEQGINTVGKTLHLDLTEPNGNIVKVI